MNPLPPPEVLAEVLSYCPHTGALTWRQTGRPAGWLEPDGYRRLEFQGATYRAHRVAWCLLHGADPGPLLVDHLNRNRSDNRASNLRLVDARGNRANAADGSRPVQVRYPDGSTRLLPSTEAAARYLGCHPRSVYRYARGLRAAPNGLTVAYAAAP
jgi:hypothetical protein